MRDRTTSVNPHPVEAVAAEGTNVLFDTWLTSRAVTGLLDSALAPTGLTADEFAIYSVLTSAETLTPSDLARWMAAPSTSVSSYVKRLEGRGHLVRERNPTDGRSFLLRLTASGHEAHQQAGAAFLPALREVVDLLGRSEGQVRRSLERLREAAEVASERLAD